jgi:periplasmic protein TonB
MFEDTLIPSTRKRRTIWLGYMIEASLLALLVLVPLIHVQALPESVIRTGIAPPPHGSSARPATARPVRRPSLSELLAAPVTVPTTIPQLRLEQRAAPGYSSVAAPPGVVPWGGGNGVPGGFGDSPLPLPPAPPVRPPNTSRITVGGVVEAARLIDEIQPEYPALARSARVQGTVRLEAIISKDGSVESLHVLSGPPLLIPSALRAVQQWRYQPTLLNGAPVEVATEIDVNFVLNE